MMDAFDSFFSRIKALVLFCSAALLCPHVSWGQFSRRVIVTYEKKENNKLKLQGVKDDSWKKYALARLPATYSTFFTLYIDGDKAAYFFDKEQGLEQSYLRRQIANQNNVWTDFSGGQQVAQKQIYETLFLVEDTLPRFSWKIHAETREIAGYMCRKATTVLDDSLVVVAFYTDQIMQSSGPESFGGLPGTILGLAIPRLYATWFATKVELSASPEEKFVPASKGKVVDRKALKKNLEAITKSWKEEGRELMWWSSI